MKSQLSFSLSLLFLLFTLAQSPPPEYDGCPPRILTCECGDRNGMGNEYNFAVEVRQCNRHRRKLKCRDCRGDPRDHERCFSYRFCMDCQTGVDECTTCPPGRYGKWCTGNCPSCDNGGHCDRYTGMCVCPAGFQGQNCEQQIMVAECPPPPSITSGFFDPAAQSYQIGSSVTYRCDAGHLMQGNPTIYCLENAWWSNPIPICNTYDCPTPIQPPNGIVYHDQQLRTLTYACEPEYALIGPSTRTCGPNSTWTGTDPVCSKITTCSFPAPPENGHVQLDTADQRSPVPGSLAQFSCQPNYILMGEEKVICDQNGNWSSSTPKCIPEASTCPHPGEIVDGQMVIADTQKAASFQIGTTLQYSCNPLHFLLGNQSITCNSDNTWSGPLPTCTKVITCSAFESIHSGRVDIFAPDSTSDSVFRVLSPNVAFRTNTGLRFRSAIPTMAPEHRSASLSILLPPGNYHIGTRASFSCISRYYNLIGSKVRTCQSSGEWSGRPPTCVPICGRSSAPRIPLVTHGTPSNVGQWPWLVGLARRLEENDPLGEWFIMCGASVVNEQWVVTAAHCVTYSSSTVVIPDQEFKLYFGKYYRNDSLDDGLVQVRQVEEIQVHPDFEPTTFESDIALLRVAPEITFTSRVQPVCLPKNDADNDERVQEGNLGTVIGWGMKEDGTFSEFLQHAQVPLVRQSKCQEDYRRLGVPVVISANMICAGNETGGYDSCSGDSGGPLVFPKDQNSDQWVLEGIVSWGSPFGCGNERQYGGYARVRRFMNWIDEFI